MNRSLPSHDLRAPDATTVRERLAERQPLLMGGGVGTELQRRGVPVRQPLWTSRALLDGVGRDQLAAIHADYVMAGARLVTANTFRTNPRTARLAGKTAAEAASWSRAAVEVARCSSVLTSGELAWVAGSVAPVGDCYQPAEVPPQSELADEHGAHVYNLREAGVDLILAETQNTAREAGAICRAALACKLDVIVSFVCGDDGRPLSGEPWGEVLDQVMIEPQVPLGFAVNCTSLTRSVLALECLAKHTSTPLGLYPNIEHRVGASARGPIDEYVPSEHDPTVFTDWMLAQAGRFRLRFLGGCCGSGPEHISALSKALNLREWLDRDPI